MEEKRFTDALRHYKECLDIVAPNSEESYTPYINERISYEVRDAYKPLRELLSERDFLKCSEEEVIEHSRLAIATIDILLVREWGKCPDEAKDLTEKAWENENELRRLGQGFASEDEQAKEYLKKAREAFDCFPHMIHNQHRTESILFYIRHLVNNSRKREELRRLIREVEKAMDKKRQRRKEIDFFDIDKLNEARKELALTCKSLRSLMSEEDFLKCSEEEVIEHSRLAIGTIDELLGKVDKADDNLKNDENRLYFVNELIEVAWENENELRRLGRGLASEDEQAETYLKKAREAFDRYPHGIDNQHRTESILFYIRHLVNNSRKREELRRLIREVEKAMDEKRQRGEEIDYWDTIKLDETREELVHVCKPLRSLLNEKDFLKCSKEEIIEHSSHAIATIDAFLARADNVDRNLKDDEDRLNFAKELIEIAWENENELRRLGQGFASEDKQAEEYLKKAREAFDCFPHMIHNQHRTESILFCIRHLGKNSPIQEELERLIQEVEKALDEKRRDGQKIDNHDVEKLNKARKKLAHACKPLRSLLSEEDFWKCSKEEIIEHSSLAIATIDELLARANKTNGILAVDEDRLYFVKEFLKIAWENENELWRLRQGRFASEDEQAEKYLKTAREIFNHYPHMIDDEYRTESILFYIRHLGKNSRKREELERLIQEIAKRKGYSTAVAKLCEPLRSLLSEEDFLKCSEEEIIKHSSLAIATIDELIGKVGGTWRTNVVRKIIEVAWENESELRRLGQGRFANEDEQAEAYLKKAREVFDCFPDKIDDSDRTESILFYIRRLGSNSRKREELQRLIREVEEARDERRERGKTIVQRNIQKLNEVRKEFAYTCKPLRSLLSEKDFLKCSKEEIIEHSSHAIATIDELLATIGETWYTNVAKKLIEVAWENENELRRLGEGRFASEDEQAEEYLKKARETFNRFPHLIDDEHRTGPILFCIRHLGNNSRKQEELGRLIREVEKAMGKKRRSGEDVYDGDIEKLNEARKELAHTYKPLRSLLSEEDFLKRSKEQLIEHSRRAIATIDELLARVDMEEFSTYLAKELIEVAWENDNELRGLGQGRFANEDEQAEEYLKKAREAFDCFPHMIHNQHRTESILFCIRHLGNNSRKREELKRLIKEVEKAMGKKRQRGEKIYSNWKLNEARNELELLLA